MAITYKVPELGENIKTARVIKILVAPGDTIQLEQSVVELETDKAILEIPSEVAGTVGEVLVKAGDDVKAGQALFVMSSGGTPPDSKAEPPAGEPESKPETPKAQAPDRPESKASAPPLPVDPLPAAPSVRRYAREMGIDLRTVTGRGPQGRISLEDVKAHLGEGASLPQGGGAPLPDFTQWGAVDRKPMSPVRRVTAERVSQAWAVIPHVTQFARVDVTEIEALRLRYKADAERVGGHLSLTTVLVKAVVGALKVFPQFNASVDLPRHEIVHKNYFNIGVAMDTNRGLMVPVLRGVDRKNLIELAVELAGVTAKARDGKLTVDEMQGGTFTITNAGALGGDIFTPIVNWPEVAILGIGQKRMEAIFRDGEFKPRPMLPLSLSFDHRVIDGADGVRFLRWIVEALEDPTKLWWEG